MLFESFLDMIDGFCATLLEKELSPVPSTKNLGVQVDETLSYDEHITNTVSVCVARPCQGPRRNFEIGGA